LTSIGRPKNTKKGFRPLGHRSVELGFDLCFQQNVYGGWGQWLRDAGRGTQKDRVIGTSGDRKGKNPPRIIAENSQSPEDREGTSGNADRNRSRIVWHRGSSPLRKKRSRSEFQKTTASAAQSLSASGISLVCLCSWFRKASRAGRRVSGKGVHWNRSWPARECCWKFRE
jgi:hypothetical protein